MAIYAPVRALAALKPVRKREIRRICISFHHPGPGLWAPGSGWYFESSSGLSLADLGPHCFDVIQSVGFSAGPLDARVYSEGSAKQHSSHVDMVLLGGVRAHVECGWDAAKPRFNVCISGKFGSIGASLAGPVKGLWAAAPSTKKLGNFSDRHLAARSSQDLERHGWHRLITPAERRGRGPYQDFIYAIQTGRRPQTDVTRLYPWAEVLANLVVRQSNSVNP